MLKLDEKLFEKMRTAVNDTVKHYPADFGIDVAWLMSLDDTNKNDWLLWIVRECGTNLTCYKDTAEVFVHCYQGDKSAKFFLLNVGQSYIVELDKENIDLKKIQDMLIEYKK